MKKNEKSFKKLLKQMDELQENQLGKLKGGIAVVSPLSFELDANSNVCVNNGSCDGQDNSGLCFNNKSDCQQK